jgi:hypothetical protein
MVIRLGFDFTGCRVVFKEKKRRIVIDVKCRDVIWMM